MNQNINLTTTVFYILIQIIGHLLLLASVTLDFQMSETLSAPMAGTCLFKVKATIKYLFLGGVPQRSVSCMIVHP